MISHNYCNILYTILLISNHPTTASSNTSTGCRVSYPVPCSICDAQVGHSVIPVSAGASSISSNISAPVSVEYSYLSGGACDDFGDCCGVVCGRVAEAAGFRHVAEVSVSGRLRERISLLWLFPVLADQRWAEQFDNTRLSSRRGVRSCHGSVGVGRPPLAVAVTVE